MGNPVATGTTGLALVGDFPSYRPPAEMASPGGGLYYCPVAGAHGPAPAEAFPSAQWQAQEGQLCWGSFLAFGLRHERVSLGGGLS